ncbi:hypothetical protein [Herpetosiphon giganteus]|uniref:hypothetical protein n=1 Tax=Herpetosiphon giganteus TaxID=2029754 RepID=UPI0019586032|nr:hypothetical protein [Herpetosiphon giganteus]MBM7846230.1 hypothetical protein [Herpetosiphon giganteus]
MNDLQIAEQLQASYGLFAPIRAHFRGPGVERGGCPRHGMHAVYAKKYGEHLATIYPGISSIGVESSFEASQLPAIMAALAALREVLLANLAHRIVEYAQASKPYLLPAYLRSIELALEHFAKRYPEQLAALDAVFSVAGGEGFRDLIVFHGGHLLEQAKAGALWTNIDMYSLVDLHDRETPEGLQKFEVWCLGGDLAKAVLAEFQKAALMLVTQGWQPQPLTKELALLPVDLNRHFGQMVRNLLHTALSQYVLG